MRPELLIQQPLHPSTQLASNTSWTQRLLLFPALHDDNRYYVGANIGIESEFFRGMESRIREQRILRSARCIGALHIASCRIIATTEYRQIYVDHPRPGRYLASESLPEPLASEKPYARCRLHLNLDLLRFLYAP